MLVGEPGVGKTRTVQELETYARMRGAEVYWGRTHESSGTPAYWPWLQVGRAWGAQQDFSLPGVRTAVANPELVRLFPELRQTIPDLTEPPVHADPESAQFLLFDAYTQFVRAQSSGTPWVVVLDDLHWADKPTLQLLQFVARELANIHVLIVATYRDTDLVRTHPLSEALAELNREGGFRRVVLKGLDADEVAAYVRQRASVEPSPALLDRVYEETEGNPFFLSEVVNLLVQEDTLDSESVSDITLPDGVREALGRRLDRLSAEANELLQVAAVMGRDFAYETLVLLGDREPEALLGMIEESIAAQVIEEIPPAGRYRFTHALMQETLREELSTTRRVRLHGTIAEALEQHPGEETAERVALLARHYRESSLLTAKHAAKARQYSMIAAEIALGQFAWADAVEHAAAALVGVGDVADAGFEAKVRLNLGRALLGDGQSPAGLREIESAQLIFERLDDRAGALDCVRAIRPAVGAAPIEQPRRMIDRVLAMLDQDDDADRAWLLVEAAGFSAASVIVMGSPEKDQEAELAREIAQRLELPDLLAQLRMRDGLRAAQKDRAGAHLLFEQARADFLADDDPISAATAAFNAANVAPSVDQAMSDWASVTRIRAAIGHSYGAHVGTLFRAVMAVEARGDHRLALEIVSGRISNHYLASFIRALCHDLTGASDLALSELSAIDSSTLPTVMAPVMHGLRSRFLMNTGDHAAAAAEASPALDYIQETPDYAAVWTLGFSLDALAQNSTADEFSRIVEDWWVLTCVGVGWPEDLLWVFFIPGRAFGLAALKRGELDSAEEHFSAALLGAQRERLPIEAGRCYLALAEVAEQRGDLERAREHLDAAGELFSNLGAKLYLDRVIAKKEILNA